MYLRFEDPPCSESRNCTDQIGIVSDGYKGYLLAWKHNATSSPIQILASTGISQFEPKKANQLTIFVDGDEFRIFVNGIFVRSFTDSSYNSGIFVLDADNATTSFNNVRIYAIP